MNIIDFIARRNFLEQLYPSGIATKIMIGQLSLDVGGRCYLNIHTRLKPAIDVAKWGNWSEDYNTVVIKLTGSRVTSIHANNWLKADYHDLVVDYNQDLITLTQKSENWDFTLTLGGLVFQSCDVYLDNREDPAF